MQFNADVTTDWDVEQYRLPWDSDEQWEVRREFMLAHKTRFDEDRLVCLAQVYANIEFLGCSYPAAVMKQVAALAEGLSTDHRDQKKEREEVKFVKATNDKANTGVKRKFEQTNSARWEPPPSASTAHMNRSSAASYFTGSSASAQQIPNKYQTQNYYTTSGYNSNPQQHQRHQSGNQQSSWGATTSYRPVIVDYGGQGRGGRGGGRGGNFGGSRWTGHHSGETSHGRTTSRGSAPELPQKTLSAIEVALEGFVILEPANGDGLNSNGQQTVINKLCSSAQFSKKTIQFNCDFVLGAGNIAVHRCAVQLAGVEVAAAEDTTKAKAKMAAAEAALHRLSAMAPTLKVKQAVVSDGAFSRDGVCGVAGADEKIGSDNVGNKLLKLMGWSGGGLGTSGREGITEPVKAQVVYGRQGFGLARQNGIGDEFLKRFTKIVSDYARSDMSKDLAFTSEFTKEERAEMHKMAKRFRLKSTSRGKGDSRFLVISRHFGGAQQLVQHVVSEGGSTEKYELILPGQG